MNPRKPLVEYCFKLTNARPTEMLLHLEPRGDQYLIPSGVSYEIHALGPAGPEGLEIDPGEEAVTVHGWSGSVVQVLLEGKEVDRGLGARQPAPETPHVQG